MASQSKYLPEDIMMEILYRLPVKSLVRFRCVCKAWHHIISATSFVITHLTYQKTSANKYILFDGNLYCSLSVDCEPIIKRIRSKSKEYHPLKLFNRGEGYGAPKIYGVCNGLLCLANRGYLMGENIYLYNPSCRKIKKLPQLDFEDAGFTENVPGVSFGYYDDDYKVVVFAPVGDDAYTVYVYGLSNNSWKHIDASFDVNYHMLSMDTKFVTDTVYAMTAAQIICFDLSDETLRVVEFPAKLVFQPKTMEAYGETIAVLEYEVIKPKSLNLWISRDKFSSKSSWERKFSLKLQKGCNDAKAVGILDNGKYLVRTLSDAADLITYFLCDPYLGTLTEFRSMDSGRCAVYPNGYIHSDYVESLLLLNEDSVDPNW